MPVGRPGRLSARRCGRAGALGAGAERARAARRADCAGIQNPKIRAGSGLRAVADAESLSGRHGVQFRRIPEHAQLAWFGFRFGRAEGIRAVTGGVIAAGRPVGSCVARSVGRSRASRGVAVRASALRGVVLLGGAATCRTLALLESTLPLMSRSLPLLNARLHDLLSQFRHFITESFHVAAEPLDRADQFLALPPEQAPLAASVNLVLKLLGLPSDLSGLIVQTGGLEVLGGGTEVLDSANGFNIDVGIMQADVFGAAPHPIAAAFGPCESLGRAAFASAEAVLPVLAQLCRCTAELCGVFKAAFAAGTRDLLAQIEQLIEQSFFLAAAQPTLVFPFKSLGWAAFTGAEAVLPVLAKLFRAPPELIGQFAASCTSSTVDLPAQLEQPVEQARVCLRRPPALPATEPFSRASALTLLHFGAAVLVACALTLLLFVAALFGLSTSVVVAFLGGEPKPADGEHQGE